MAPPLAGLFFWAFTVLCPPQAGCAVSDPVHKFQTKAECVTKTEELVLPIYKHPLFGSFEARGGKVYRGCLERPEDWKGPAKEVVEELRK